jgi:hypothetical protein
MKKIDVGQAIAVLANIGVIAGIVFLAIEIRQDNAMNQITIENAAQEHFSTFRSLVLENDDLFRIWEEGLLGSELTALEQAKFNELCDEHMYRMFQSYRMRFRLDPATEYRSSARVVGLFIAESDAYARCWARMRPAFQGPDNFNFAERVEGSLQ